MQRTAELHREEVYAISEKEGRAGLHASDAGRSSSNAGQCLELTVCSKNNALEISSGTSDPKQCNESKMQENKRLLKLLDYRLRILEEDDENLKGELMSSMKERSELISEVRELHGNLRLKGQESGEIQSHGFLAIEPQQVLMQQFCNINLFKLMPQ